MRKRWLRIGLWVAAMVIPTIAFSFTRPVSVDTTEFNTDCLRHRRCVTRLFGLTQKCQTYPDQKEDWRLGKPTATAESCSQADWFVMSSCSYFLSGMVACAHASRRGTAAVIYAFERLASTQAEYRHQTGYYLSRAPARELWSPPGEYQLGACGGEVTTFEPEVASS